MYYIGTKQECEDYNNQVTLGERYKFSTVRWENVSHHKNGIEFAIFKHKNYESEMQTIDKIPDSWSNNSEI
jgi:lysylphosphatidylglycerol synthetase-like protein (DUF2156 family)